jgi:hypothetical protein
MTLRRAVVAAFAVGAAAAAIGIGVRGSHGAQTTGDEPHYLLTALSLAGDGSLDIRDELAARAYEPWHEATIDPQEKPLEDGRMVTPHDPLLPALLAAPLALGGWVAAKATLAMLAGLLAALLVWTAVRRFGVRPGVALLVVAVFAASSPFAVYGSQVYPELPAALAVTAAIAGLAAPLAVIVLPWLSVKYAVVAAVLAVPTIRRRPRLVFLYVGAAAAFFLAHKAWYGGWTPYAAGDHFVGGELTVIGHDPEYAGRARRLVGLVVDRTFGLAAWQPAWLLAVPAVASLVAARPRGWKLLAAVLGAGWLVATFVALTMHGWWWPGRQLVVALPAAVLAVAWWAGRSRRALAAVAGIGAIGVATHLFFVVEAYWAPRTWVVDFFRTENPWYRAWRQALPDFWHETGATWLLAVPWTLALAGAAAYAYTATRRACGSTDTRAPSGTTSLDGRCETTTVPSSATR